MSGLRASVRSGCIPEISTTSRRREWQGSVSGPSGDGPNVLDGDPINIGKRDTLRSTSGLRSLRFVARNEAKATKAILLASVVGACHYHIFFGSLSRTLVHLENACVRSEEEE